jgi:hypothetical protein
VRRADFWCELLSRTGNLRILGADASAGLWTLVFRATNKVTANLLTQHHAAGIADWPLKPLRQLKHETSSGWTLRDRGGGFERREVGSFRE